jgi:hypothetical protein
MIALSKEIYIYYIHIQYINPIGFPYISLPLSHLTVNAWDTVPLGCGAEAKNNLDLLSITKPDLVLTPSKNWRMLMVI